MKIVKLSHKTFNYESIEEYNQIIWHGDAIDFRMKLTLLYEMLHKQKNHPMNLREIGCKRYLRRTRGKYRPKY